MSARDQLEEEAGGGGGSGAGELGSIVPFDDWVKSLGISSTAYDDDGTNGSIGVGVGAGVGAEDYNDSLPFPYYPDDFVYDEGDFTGEIPDLAQEDRQFIFIVEGIILTAVSFAGIVGTTMSIGVLVKPAARESFSGLLTGLAVCDTLFLCTSLVMFGLPKLWLWFAENVTNPTASFTFGLLHIWRVGSTYLTLSVTLERYCAICHPLSTAIKQKYLLVGSLAFAVVYNIPKFFEMNVMILDNGEVFTVQTEMRKNKHYQQFYVFWSKMILIELFPYVTIIVLNTLILTKTLKASRFRRAFAQGGVTGDSHRANSISMMDPASARRFSAAPRRVSQMTECLPLNQMGLAGVGGHGCGNGCSTSANGNGNGNGVGNGGGNGGDNGNGNGNGDDDSPRNPVIVTAAEKEEKGAGDVDVEAAQPKGDKDDGNEKHRKEGKGEGGGEGAESSSSDGGEGSANITKSPSCSDSDEEAAKAFIQRRKGQQKTNSNKSQTLNEETDRPIGPKRERPPRKFSRASIDPCLSPSVASALMANHHQQQHNDLPHCGVAQSSANVLSPTYGIRSHRSLSIPDIVPISSPPVAVSSSNATVIVGPSISPCPASSSAALSPGPPPYLGGRARSVSQVTIVRAPVSSASPAVKISVTANKDKALGATLIGVSVLFLGCQSVKLIPDIYEGFICGQDYCETNKVISTLITLSNLFMCINSAANFLMYMVRGTKFRMAFINTYTSCFRK